MTTAQYLFFPSSTSIGFVKSHKFIYSSENVISYRPSQSPSCQCTFTCLTNLTSIIYTLTILQHIWESRSQAYAGLVVHVVPNERTERLLKDYPAMKNCWIWQIQITLGEEDIFRHSSGV